MVLQHNLSALNARRQLGINNSQTASNLEKLASGYRINRAADDAAGLAISEKMRGQIRGLDMAAQNTDNAISLIQTAEGGLNEIHSILHRLRELSVQSSNGTYDDMDREQIDREVAALVSEIDRIAGSTHYNGINLLDGTLGGQRASAITAGNNPAGSKGALQAYLNQLGFAASANNTSVQITSYSPSLEYVNLHVQTECYPNRLILQSGDKTYVGVLSQANGNNYDTADGQSVALNVNAAYLFYDEEGKVVAKLVNMNGSNPFVIQGDTSGVITNMKLSYQKSTPPSDNTPTSIFPGTPDAPSKEGHPLYEAFLADDSSNLIFQIGANGTADQQVGLHVDNMASFNLGSRIATAYNATGSIADIDLTTRESANDAMAIIEYAVNQVSGTRAALGALQNRMEHTLNNLGVTSENLQAAESTIRDVDMAKEMMEFTKNNILVQASQSMLAQANQLPQGVLSLLQ